MAADCCKRDQAQHSASETSANMTKSLKMHIKRYCVVFPKSAGKYEPPDIGPSEWEKCDQDEYEEETHYSLDQVCGILAVGCFVPDSLSNRCRMDTKLKNDQQLGGASSPAKPPSIKLRVAIEPFKARAFPPFHFKTRLSVISTPSAPPDPGQKQVWEKQQRFHKS